MRGQGVAHGPKPTTSSMKLGGGIVRRWGILLLKEIFETSDYVIMVV